MIPLVGGADRKAGKRPVIRWQTFTRRQPSPAEVQAWFGGREAAAYGVVCGAISGLVVLDLDDPLLAERFAGAFPDLFDTLVVRSGLRGTPHVYWRVDFPVRTRSFAGGDLKAEGSYVVGPGSVIAGGAWRALSDREPRSISQDQLESVLAFLLPSSAQPVRMHSEKGSGDYAALYRFYVDRLGSRNNALFRVACQMRNAGISEPQVVAMLAGTHARQPSLDESQESFSRRLAEARRTIRSAFSRPPSGPRPESDSLVSRLPNALREALLTWPDGAAAARMIDAAFLKGLLPGAVVTEPVLCRVLKGVLSRETIRKALAVCAGDGQPIFCPPDNPPAQADIPDGIEGQKHAFLSAGQKQTTTRLFVLPDPERLCARLGLTLRGGDPITLDDVSSARRYRQALHRALLKRRPGTYSQRLLAERLGVSSRSIRRYNVDLGVRAQPTYRETPVLWATLDTLPQAEDIRRFGLHTGGQFLLDDSGKRWPLKREIAAHLLSRGRRVSHMQQGPNTYWCGEFPAVFARRDVPAGAESTLCETSLPKPPLSQPARASAGRASDALSLAVPKRPQESLNYAQEGASMLRKAELAVNIRETPLCASKRRFRQPLPDSAAERLAQRVQKQVPAISLPNARRLVDAYGCEATGAALRKVGWLHARGKASRPAGLLITLARAGWRTRQRDLDPGAPAPCFTAEPRRRSRSERYVAPQDDPLWRSIPYRDWRAEFFSLDDPLLAATLEEIAY